MPLSKYQRIARKLPVEEMPQCYEEQPKTLKNEEQWEKSRKITILKNWEINIRFHDIGCVVHVGCKSFAFESVSSAMQVVNQYTNDPAAVAKAYGFERDL
jgi:hypothetical protein